VDSAAGQDDEEYTTNTELDEEVNGHRCTEQRRHRHEVGPRPPRQECHTTKFQIFECD
jgi:hypothetical protein